MKIRLAQLAALLGILLIPTSETASTGVTRGGSLLPSGSTGLMVDSSDPEALQGLAEQLIEAAETDGEVSYGGKKFKVKKDPNKHGAVVSLARAMVAPELSTADAFETAAGSRVVMVPASEGDSDTATLMVFGRNVTAATRVRINVLYAAGASRAEAEEVSQNLREEYGDRVSSYDVRTLAALGDDRLDDPNTVTVIVGAPNELLDREDLRAAVDTSAAVEPMRVTPETGGGLRRRAQTSAVVNATESAGNVTSANATAATRSPAAPPKSGWQVVPIADDLTSGKGNTVVTIPANSTGVIKISLGTSVLQWGDREVRPGLHRGGEYPVASTPFTLTLDPNVHHQMQQVMQAGGYVQITPWFHPAGVLQSSVIGSSGVTIEVFDQDRNSLGTIQQTLPEGTFFGSSARTAAGSATGELSTNIRGATVRNNQPSLVVPKSTSDRDLKIGLGVTAGYFGLPSLALCLAALIESRKQARREAFLGGRAPTGGQPVTAMSSRQPASSSGNRGNPRSGRVAPEDDDAPSSGGNDVRLV